MESSEARTEQDARDEEHPPPRVLLVPDRLLLFGIVAQEHLRPDPHRHREEPHAEDEIHLAEYPVQRDGRELLGFTAAPSVVLVVGDVRVVVAVVVVRAGLMMMRAAGLPLALYRSCALPRLGVVVFVNAREYEQVLSSSSSSSVLHFREEIKRQQL